MAESPLSLTADFSTLSAFRRGTISRNAKSSPAVVTVTAAMLAKNSGPMRLRIQWTNGAEGWLWRTGNSPLEKKSHWSENIMWPPRFSISVMALLVLRALLETMPNQTDKTATTQSSVRRRIVNHETEANLMRAR